jgi:hypothetical protein
MGLELLIDIIHSQTQDSWSKRNSQAFEALFGSPEGRYPKSAARAVTLRSPEMSAESGVPFAAYIHPSNPTSGAYSGLSFVVFRKRLRITGGHFTDDDRVWIKLGRKPSCAEGVQRAA